MIQLSHPYLTTAKTMAIWTSVSKVMSLLFKELSRFVTVFLPRSKRLLIFWLESLSTVILEPKKIKSVTASTFSPSVCHELMWLDAMIFFFFHVEFQGCFFTLFFHPLSRGSLIHLYFPPLEWYHLHIWGYWYFSQQSSFLFVCFYPDSSSLCLILSSLHPDSFPFYGLNLSYINLTLFLSRAWLCFSLHPWFQLVIHPSWHFAWCTLHIS